MDPSQGQFEQPRPLGGPEDETDPAMAEQMRVDAERAAESGASAALLEAQAAQSLALQREAAEEASDPQPNFDLGEEFGIGSTKQHQQPASAATDPNATQFTDPTHRTFLTGVDNASQANLMQQQQQQQQAYGQTQDQQQPIDPNLRMSDEELMSVEMRLVCLPAHVHVPFAHSRLVPLTSSPPLLQRSRRAPDA